MKFVALLAVAAVRAADPEEAKTGATCADPKAFVCKKTDCCGTVTDKDAKAGVVAISDAAGSNYATFAKTVCLAKPADADTKEKADPNNAEKKIPGVGTAVEVKPAVVAKAADGDTPAVVAAAAVMGTFLCNASETADAGAASYMTVGAAAIIAAATLLQ